MPPRFCFVAGLHRTGTSLVAKLLGEHPDISTIRGAPVPENEGCYLQGAIPHTARSGAPGRFAIDPAQHYVEGGPYDTLETKQRLWADWEPWFDTSKPWLVEKSPVNLTRMRLLQALFPMSQFIIVLRHPQAMAKALEKWTDQSEAELVDYALSAYELAKIDAAFLHAALFLRYEDLVADPGRYREAVFAFLGLEEPQSDLSIRDGNADYSITRELGPIQKARAMAFGYGHRGAILPCEQTANHPLRSVREHVARIVSEKRAFI